MIKKRKNICLLSIFSLIIVFCGMMFSTFPPQNITTASAEIIDAVSRMDKTDALKSYDKLKVVNRVRNKKWGDWRYAYFVEYFDIVRTDGRKIYDDDGYLDVRHWDTGDFYPSDEVVDYSADLYVKTTVMHHNYNGFLGTVLNSKWQKGVFDLTWAREQDPEDGFTVNIHDKNANTMGSGKYRNNGINPGNEYYKLTDMHWYDGSPYVTVGVIGKGYWENGWWGGSYGHTDVYAWVSGFMPRAKRDWTNELNSEVLKEGNKHYSALPYVVTARNLNNFIKIDDYKIEPIQNELVMPFKDGLKTKIDQEGITKVSIEDGAENRYSDYYCYLDQTLPDITVNYINDNGTDNLTKGTIRTDPYTGVKTQTITGGIFKDQVQIMFGAESEESPETATVKFNGITKPLTSGTWLNEDGLYEIAVKDKVGHTKTLKFEIDTKTPTTNFENISKGDFKVSKWFIADIPSEFNEGGRYSYKTYEEALEKAMVCERNNLVTNYTLNNISNFKNTHLLANGDSVKVGKYYYYKSISNSNLYVYYFDEELLANAIKKHATNYVSNAKYYNYRPDIFPNNYGEYENDIAHNLWNEDQTPAYVINDFVFRKKDNNDSYKLFYNYLDDGNEEWVEFLYNIPFKEQVARHGLYQIKEMDYVGHENIYNVFLDLEPPKLKVTAKVYGSDESFTHYISQKDIPQNNELIYYYEEFAINEIIDNDTWYVMQIVSPDGTMQKYTRVDTLPDFSKMATGEYVITLYDRVKNHFSFKVVLLGKAPRVRFQTTEGNQKLKVDVIAGDEYNEITSIKIFRNETFEGEYFNERTFEFLKGGLYRVELLDIFGRITNHEFKFEKNLPKGVLQGVKDGGKTNKDVKFIYDSNKYIVKVFENDIAILMEEEIDGNLITIRFDADQDKHDNYKIVLYDNTDLDNINIYKFTIKTTPPEISLHGVTTAGTTAGDVYVSWNIQELNTATITCNDKEETYINSQTISNDGVYIITVTDELGNFQSVAFEIDKTLEFSVYADDVKKDIEDIRHTNNSIKIERFEPLNIEIKKDDLAFSYEFGNSFNEDGHYVVKIFDDYGNVKYFEFEIDKTKPIASLIGVENNGTTGGKVQVVFGEKNLSAELFLNDEFIGNYDNEDEIVLNGKYKVIVSDLAGNTLAFDFEIDNEIEFDINTFYGGISNQKVRVIAKEDLLINMQKDKEIIEYQFEQLLEEDGFYEFILTDSLGNQLYFNFYILNSPLNRFEKRYEDFIEILEIQKDKEIQELDIENNTLYLVDEGSYTITVFDKTVNKNFTFDIDIDTTPPSIVLVGAENKGYTKSEVSTRTPSEKPITIEVMFNEEKIEYQLGDKVKDAGRYVLVVTDQAGNETVYEFTIVHSMNGATIGLFAGMLAVVVILIIFLVKNKVGFYKGKQDIIETDETVEEIDNIEEK